ncbi:hypothetical protein [Filimonas effusa]|uniref:Uncharacterized protein n=1 Tax=Filimonas effusa TaxID=2508721 RepID=A0A4Q1DDY7_9BACT|nr:hypothetical protein [Filimonas effusa]RXK87115.1 hypothetical protein ESB13_10130 [Filimonas effusa]
MKKAGWMAALLLVAATACNSEGIVRTKAHILERKMLSNGKLLINYVFRAPHGEVITDSVAVDEHKVIPHDSVPLIFSPKNPKENELEIGK